MQRRDYITLKKITEEIDIAIEMMENISFEKFDSDEMLKRAVCMTVINKGELVKNLSDEFRESSKSIPWKQIAGFRDIAAHKYGTLRMKDVFVTVADDFPALKNNISDILLHDEA